MFYLCKYSLQNKSTDEGSKMKVKDLIEQLSKYNPETLVLVSGYEGGLESGIFVSEQEVHKYDMPYMGDYENWYDYEKETQPDEKFIKAVTIERGGERT
jgi:hypothetical protein